MMNYEEFREKVVEDFLGYFPEEYQDWKVELSEVNKVNRTLDGIGICPPDLQGKKVVPTCYIQDMYERYKEYGDFDLAMNEQSRIYQEAIEEANVFQIDLSPETVKNNIVFCLVNKEQNEKMLNNMPYREKEDLAIIYRYIVKQNKEGIASSQVTNAFMEKYGLTEQELFRLAYDNTKRLFPVTIKPMLEVVKAMMTNNGEFDLPEEMFLEEFSEPEEYIISNANGINGSSSILYPEELKKLADKVGDDLFILPSSIHETIAIPAEGADPVELSEMVTEINKSSVSVEERLSNQVYFFDRKSMVLTQATNTKETKLDSEEITYNNVKK